MTGGAAATAAFGGSRGGAIALAGVGYHREAYRHAKQGHYYEAVLHEEFVNGPGSWWLPPAES